jgi:hypothetical protein
MAFEAATLLQLILLITWTVLSDTPANQKNTLFTQFFTSEAVFGEIAATASLVFAPNLLNVLRAAAPPTVQYFKTLPTEISNRWAIYLLVLEKSGCRPRVYIGSGTNTQGGIQARFHQYDILYQLPKYVQIAVDEGYIIAHKGLLCWMTMPAPALQPMLRLLFLALEATFSYVFWAMKTVTKGYGMAHICLRDREILDYDGLCSHCCLYEGIRGDFDLSAEQLEASAIQKKETRAEKQTVHNSNYHHKQMETNHDEYLEEMAERVRNHRAQNPEKFRAQERANNARNKDIKKYFCKLCKVACQKKSDLDVHLETRSHKNRASNFATKPHKCFPCSWGTDRLSNMNDHRKSKRHLMNVAASPSSELD